MTRQQVIAERLKSLKSQIPQTVCLVAVSKYTSIEDIEYAHQIGQQDFGENRVDEITTKAQYFQNNDLSEIQWHFIGKIQTNKINRLLKVPNLAFIHSIDSLKLLEELYKKENFLVSQRLHFFLQINTSEEPQKQGFVDRNELYQAIKLCLKNAQSKMQLLGLMTMAHLNKDPRPYFHKLVLLRNEIAQYFSINNLKLSMGMGNDFSIAVEEGADFVRIGRRIFKNEAP